MTDLRSAANAAGRVLTPARASVNEPDYQAMAQFRRALRAFLHFSEQSARQAGLTPGQYQLLLVIRGSGVGPSPTVGELADWLKVRHNSVVGLVNRAETAGLVIRTGDSSDHRFQRVALTDKGAAQLSLLAQEHRVELGRLAHELREAKGRL
jgi:DNA-binding MarR family transcriptional regulator